MVMLAVIVLGLSWVLVTRLSSANFVAGERKHNAKVLNQAKQALIGWVAQRAAQTDNNPGRLPCPEAINSIGTNSEGISAPQISPVTPNCAVVGRLPWRTLGLDKLLDAAAEPLWYVVSPGWALQNSSTLLTINSNTKGALVVDGQAAPNDVVALIIAPGPAMDIAATGSCTARVQARSSPAPSMDSRDYIECFNTATPAFSTVGPTSSFNDQVLQISTADLLPAIEAAIAHRTEREIAPLLKSVYAGAEWGLSSTNPVFPYAAPFADPTSSSYQGMPAMFQGLPPFTANAGCTPVTDSRCATTFVAWNTTALYAPVVTMSGVTVPVYTCPTVNASTIQCIGTYVAAAVTVQLTLSTTANKVAMALRQIDPSKITVRYRELLGPPGVWQTSSATVTGQFNAGDSTSTMLSSASLPGTLTLDYEFEITANIGVLADHALLDPSNATTGWFVRNEWYRLAYYAIAPNHAASSAAPRSCSDSPLTCLSIVNMTPAGKQRAILILAGRSLPGKTRPSPALDDYLEFGNTTGAYERQPVSTAIVTALKKPFNDRVVVIDANP